MTVNLNDISALMAQRSMTSGPVHQDSAKTDSKGMEKACKEFESLFVNYLMKEMRNTIPENELFGGGSAEKMYTTMLDGEVAKHVSIQRGIGLADMLYRQMAGQNEKKE
jgi:flagellar protein FlgJ